MSDRFVSVTEKAAQACLNFEKTLQSVLRGELGKAHDCSSCLVFRLHRNEDCPACQMQRGIVS